MPIAAGPERGAARLPLAAHNSLTRQAHHGPDTGGDEALASLRRLLSWLIVLIVGLVPTLVYFVAGVVGRAIRHKARRPPAGVGADPGRERRRSLTSLDRVFDTRRCPADLNRRLARVNEAVPARTRRSPCLSSPGLCLG
jgi:hypothetical protein